MIQAFAVKLIFNQIMKRIEKTSDKKIASSHDKRITALEKNSHPPKKNVCKCNVNKKGGK